MADSGRLYTTFSQDFVRGMAAFCSRADIIVPNMTEAAFLLGESYQPGPYDKPAIEKILRKLSAMGPQRVVLTGVWLEDDMLGAAVYDRGCGEISYAFHKKIDGLYYGTGDIFASALLGALLNGFALTRAAQIAVDFTANSIERTLAAGTDARWGVNFEQELPEYIRMLGLV
jgi:Pyridoxal/pyridoxine/pyridoxamine kinase